MRPSATPDAARHIIAVTPTAMIAAWPMLRYERDFWLVIWAAVHFELGVVAAGFEVFVVEVLHRLVVDQAVDGAGVGGGVEFVGLAAQGGAPVGDLEGEGDVERQRDEGDDREARLVLHQQDADHQADLHQRGQDRVQRVADQRADRAGAAFDVAGQAAGLALEVEAQRQRVQVAEHLQRDLPHRLLGDPRKDDLAQLGEHRRRKAQRPVGGQQRRRHDDDRLIAGDVQAVHDLFEDQRHRDVGELGGDQAAEGEHHPPLPGPQVGQQLLDGLPVVAFAAGGRGGGPEGSVASW
jgi:hypothetical protein